MIKNKDKKQKGREITAVLAEGNPGQVAEIIQMNLTQ